MSVGYIKMKKKSLMINVALTIEYSGSQLMLLQMALSLDNRP